jgi:hypothetical protein
MSVNEQVSGRAMSVVELGSAGYFKPAEAVENLKSPVGNAGFEVALAERGWMRCVDARTLIEVLTDLVSHLLRAVLGCHVGHPIELLLMHRQARPEQRVALPTDMQIKRL